MEKEYLTKKLEKTALPEGQMDRHKQILREFLMQNHSKLAPKQTYFLHGKLLLPAAAITALLLIIVFYQPNPSYTAEIAQEIVMADTQVNNIIRQGGEIKDIQIIKDQAYVLLAPKTPPLYEKSQLPKTAPAPSLMATPSESSTAFVSEKSGGTLVQISLKDKKVLSIQNLGQAPLKEDNQPFEIDMENGKLKKAKKR